MPFQTKVRDQVLIEFEGSFYILSPTALALYFSIHLVFFFSCPSAPLSCEKKNQLDDPWLHMWAECCSKFVQLLKWAKFDFDQFSWQLRDEWESEKAQKKVQKIENEEKLKKYSQWK